MLGLKPVVKLIQLWFFKWAASEIDPMHEDAGYVHRRVYELERSA